MPATAFCPARPTGSQWRPRSGSAGTSSVHEAAHVDHGDSARSGAAGLTAEDVLTRKAASKNIELLADIAASAWIDSAVDYYRMPPAFSRNPGSHPFAGLTLRQVGERVQPIEGMGAFVLARSAHLALRRAEELLGAGTTQELSAEPDCFTRDRYSHFAYELRMMALSYYLTHDEISAALIRRALRGCADDGGITAR